MAALRLFSAAPRWGALHREAKKPGLAIKALAKGSGCPAAPPVGAFLPRRPRVARGSPEEGTRR